MPRYGKIQKKNKAQYENKNNVKYLSCSENYLRTLIKNYGQILNLLFDLIQIKLKFKWNGETEEAFWATQVQLVKNPSLKTPYFNKDYFITIILNLIV